MKLNKNFLVHKTKKEVIVVPSGKADFSGVINGNETFGVIIDFLKKDVTEEEIVACYNAVKNGGEYNIERKKVKIECSEEEMVVFRRLF